MKEIIKKIIKSLPVDFTRNQRYDTSTVKIMRQVLKNDSVFVDVGCHKGEVLDYAIRFAPMGRHYGFEPIPTLHAQLSKNYGAQYLIKNVGLSDHKGTSTFNYVVSNPAYSGIKKRSYPGEEEVEEITIDIDTMDSQLSEATHVDLIKIDVEGGEYGVLMGAKGIITKYQPVIIFEFGLGASDHYGTSSDQIWDFFNSLNYGVYTLKGFLNQSEAITKADLEKIYKSNTEYYFTAKPL